MAMANPPPTESGMPSRPAPRFGDIARVCSGNFLEMYDFMVFAYYAPSIAHAFFPAKSEFAQLMLTLMTFGAGYLMRPLGAIVLGAYTDRMGRRAGLILTLLIMSIGTAVLAITPGYATIGLAAPLLVLAGRLLQGLSAGVELGGVSVYLAEIAPEGRRGFYVSWQSGSQQLAVAFAAGLGVALNRFMPPAAVDSWGWRIPFVVGCAIVPVLYLLRRSLKETDAFLERHKRPSTAELLKILAVAWPTILAGMLMVTMTTVTFYVCTAYTPTLARHELHLDAGSALLITLVTGVSNFIWLPIMGTLSDRVGRRPCMLAFTVLGLLTAYPLMLWVVGAPSFGRLLALDLWLSFVFAGFNGSMVAYLTEFVPAEARTAGFSLAYSLATALFGGFTPAICTALIHATNDKAMPGAWLAAAALMGLVGVLWAGALEGRRAQAPQAALG